MTMATDLIDAYAKALDGDNAELMADTVKNGVVSAIEFGPKWAAFRMEDDTVAVITPDKGLASKAGLSDEMLMDAVTSMMSPLDLIESLMGDYPIVRRRECNG